MPINLERLRQIAEGKRNAPLVAAVRVSVTTAIRLGGVEALDPKQFPLVEIRARADACPFCAAMNRKVFRKDAFNAYLPPFHINCRCVAVHLTEGAAQENFDPKEVEPLLKHAHFVADRIAPKEVRYEALQIPARVEGRDFVFRRVKDPQTGRWVSKLTFRPSPERAMPSFHLQGLLPPAGERPVLSLVQLGRALRQLPKEVWQLPQELPRAFSPSAVIFPPKNSDLVKELDRAGQLFRIDRENGLVIINPNRFEAIVRQFSEEERLAVALRELFRPIVPTVAEASEKYQVAFQWLLTKITTLPPPAPTMTETVQARLNGIFERIRQNQNYRAPQLRQIRRRRMTIEEAIERIQNSDITINIKLHHRAPDGRHIAAHLVEDGRYMTKWEAVQLKGFPSSYGTTFESDLRVQQNLFDIPLDAHPSERPVYGAVNVLQRPEGAASSYGGHYFVLKDEVKRRATLFMHNTFGAISEEDRKSLASFTYPLNAIPETLIREGTLDYIEAHIHGGVSLRDVKRLVIDPYYIHGYPDATESILKLGAIIEALGNEVFIILENRLRQIQPTDIQSLLVGRVPTQ